MSKERLKEDMEQAVSSGKVQPVTSYGSIDETAPVDVFGSIYTDDFGESMFDDPGYYPREIDTPEKLTQRRAERQGPIFEVGAVPLRAATKAVAEVVKLPGYLVGLGDWATTGFDKEKIDSALNNAWLENIDQAEQYMKQEVMPVYVKESVANGTLTDKLTSGEFWANEGADGIGFIAAMFVPGALLKGIGKAGQLARGVQVTSKIKGFAGLQPGARLAKYANLPTKAGVYTDDAIATAANTYIEAISEGREIYNNILAKTGDKQKAGDAAAGVFKANLGVLAVSNLMDRVTLFGGFDLMKSAHKTRGLKEIGGRAAMQIPTGVAKEGFWEEGSQFSIGKYYEDKALGKTKEYASDFQGIVDTYLNSMDDVDFQTSVALGAILGSGMQARSSIKSDIKTNKDVALVKNNVVNNYQSITDILGEDTQGNPTISVSKATEYINQELNNLHDTQILDAAAMNNNREAFDYVKNIKDFNVIYPAIKEGYSQEQIETYIREYAAKQKEEGTNAGIPQEYFDNVEQDLLNKIPEYKKIVETANKDHVANFGNFQVKETDDIQKIGNFSNLVLNNRITESLNQKFLINKSEELRNDIGSDLKYNEEGKVDIKATKDSISNNESLTDSEKTDLNKKADTLDTYRKDIVKSRERQSKLNDNDYLRKQFNQKNSIDDKVDKEGENIKSKAKMDSIPEGQYLKDDSGNFYITTKDKIGNTVLKDIKNPNKKIKLNSPEELNQYTPISPEQGVIYDESKIVDPLEKVFAEQEVKKAKKVEAETKEDITKEKSTNDVETIENKFEDEDFKTVKRSIANTANGTSVRSHFTEEGRDVLTNNPEALRLAEFTDKQDVTKYHVRYSLSVPGIELPEASSEGDVFLTIGTYSKGEFTPVDVNGNAIEFSEVGEKGIVTYMTNPKESNEFGKTYYTPEGITEQEADELFQEQTKQYYKDKTALIEKLQKGESFVSQITNKSRGIQVYSFNESGLLETRPVTEIAKPGNSQLYVATNNKIELPNGETIQGKPGFPYIFNETTGNIHFVNSRVLNDNERQNIIDTFKYWVSQQSVDKRYKTPQVKVKTVEIQGQNIYDYLKSIVYFTGDDAISNFYRVNNNTGGAIILNKNTESPIDIIDPASLEGELRLNPELEDALNDYLRTSYHQVSNKILERYGGKDFKLIESFDKNGKPKIKTFKVRDGGYKKYLYDNVLVTSLTNKTITTEVGDKTLEISEPRFKNQYLIYDRTHRESLAPIEEAETIPQEDQPTKDDIVTNTDDIQDLINEFSTDAKLANDFEADDTKLTELDYRLAPEENKVSKLDVEAAQRYLNSRFGDTELKVVKGLIDNKAWGKFTKAGVELSDIASTDTVYHEAFHIVSKLYLTDTQRKQLYDTWREENDSDLSDAKVEEKLAEEYRKYVNSLKQPKGFIGRVFKAIKAFINKFRKFSTETPLDLFKAIDNGYFKYRNPVNTSTQELYRVIPGTSQSFTNEALNSINYLFFREIFHPDNMGKTFKQFKKMSGPELQTVYGRVKETLGGYIRKYGEDLKIATTEAQKQQLINNIQNISTIIKSLNNSSSKDSIVDIHTEHLRQMGITIDLEEMFNEDPDKGRDSAGNHWAEVSIKVSAKDTATTEVKTILSAIPAAEKLGNGQIANAYTSFGTPRAIDYNTISNMLFNKLADAVSEEDMLVRMIELKQVNPEVGPVINYFKVGEDNLNVDDRIILNKFYNTFNKQNIKYTGVKIDSDRNQAVHLDPTLQSRMKTAQTTWSSNINGTSKMKVSDEGAVYSDKFVDSLEQPGDTIEDKIIFLKNLGIEFTNFTGTPKQFRSLPDEMNASRFKTLTNSVYKNIKEGKTKNLFNDNLSINDEARKFYERLEALTSINIVENSHRNREGDKLYNISLHSNMSKTSSVLNAVSTKDELLKLYPHFADKSLNNSELLRNGGAIFDEDGNKRSNVNTDVAVEIYEDFSTFGDNQGDLFESLAPSDKGVMYIESTMKDKYPMLRASDNKLFRVISMPGVFTNDKGTILDQLVGYLEDEMIKWVSLKDRTEFYQYEDKLNSGPMIDIVKNSGNEELIVAFNEAMDGTREDVKSFIEEFNTDSFISSGNELSLRKLMELFLDVRQKKNIDEFLRIGTITKQKDYYNYLGKKMSEDKLNEFMAEYSARDFIGNIEQTKFFFGSPAYYKNTDNFFKRLSGPIGTKELPNTSRNLNNWINTNFKRLDGKINDIDVPSITTMTFGDKKVPSRYLEEYRKVLGEDVADRYYGYHIDKKGNKIYHMNEGDGQGYISLDEYRDLLFRMGKWDMDIQEPLYQWEIKYQEASPEQRVKLLESKPEGVFNPQKFQYFAPLKESEFIPAFYKLSLAPIIPSVAQDTEMEKLMQYMTSKQIGIAVFESANKIGAKVTELGGNPQNIFNEDFSIADLEGALTQNTYTGEWGIQVNIEQKVKDTVTTGTQEMKHIIDALRDDNGNFKEMTFRDTKATTEEIYNEYISLNNQRIQLGFDNLLDRLGLKLVDGKYESKDNFTAFKELIKDELLSRGTIEDRINMVDKINNIGIDVLSNRTQLESILYSIADKSSIRQKRTGGMKIQVSVSMMEGYKNAVDKIEVGDKKFQAADLKFYTRRDSKGRELKFVEQAEVYIPSYFKKKGIEIGEITDPRLLEILGFRIPTQGLNSIESLIIKDFLPEEAGDIIILPSEIVAKAGSDFDIDKLNIYTPNVYYDFDNNPVYLEGDYETYKDRVKNPMNRSKFELQKVENKLVELKHKIVTSPQNFERLISPIAADNMEGLADYISWLQEGKPGELKDYKRIKEVTWTQAFGLVNSLDKAAELLGAKSGVGIAANASTSHINFVHAGLGIESVITAKVGRKFLPISTKLFLESNSTEDGSIPLSKNTNKANENIQNLFNELISSYVDAAKDPYVFTINAGPKTANLFIYLLRAGIPLKTVGLFMNQPIIRDMQSQLENLGSLSYDTTRQAGDIRYKKEVVQRLIEKYGGPTDFELENAQINDRDLFTNDQLEDMISTSKLNNTQKRLQTLILQDYLRYELAADKVKELVTATSYDTKPPKNTSDLLYKNVVTDKVMRSTDFINADKLISEGSFLEGYKNIFKELESAYTPFIYALRNPILKDTLDSFISMYSHPSVKMSYDDKIKALDKLITEYYTYSLIEGTQDIVDEQDNIIKPALKSRYAELFTGNKSVPRRLKEAQSDAKYKNNPLIKVLIPVIRGENEISNITMLYRYTDKITEESLVTGWNELLDSDTQANPLGEDLLDFIILQSGKLESPMNFLSFVPGELFLERMTNAIENIKNLPLDSFINDFYSNNYRDHSIVPKNFAVDSLPFFKKWSAKLNDWFVEPNEDWGFGTMPGTNFQPKGIKKFFEFKSVVDYRGEEITNSNRVNDPIEIKLNRVYRELIEDEAVQELRGIKTQQENEIKFTEDEPTVTDIPSDEEVDENLDNCNLTELDL